MRGSTLRTELYALDGSSREQNPYTVTGYLYGVRHELGSIFFPHLLASRTTQWERGDDPMTQLQFSGDYDAVGQSRQQIAIGCPRGWRAIDDVTQPVNPFLATVTRTDFAQPAAGGPFIADRVARATTFELRQTGPSTLDELLGSVSAPGGDAVIAQTL